MHFCDMHSLHLFRHSKQVQRAAAHCHATATFLPLLPTAHASNGLLSRVRVCPALVPSRGTCRRGRLPRSPLPAQRDEKSSTWCVSTFERCWLQVQWHKFQVQCLVCTSDMSYCMEALPVHAPVFTCVLRFSCQL